MYIRYLDGWQYPLSCWISFALANQSQGPHYSAGHEISLKRERESLYIEWTVVKTCSCQPSGPIGDHDAQFLGQARSRFFIQWVIILSLI